MTSPTGTVIERLPYHPLLGRHVKHDPRSARYALPVLPKSAIASKAWTRRVPIFDQGQIGSCTGNAAAGWLGTDDSARQGLTTVPVDGKPEPVNEGLALQIYSDAEVLDGSGPYPPNDQGSSGLSVASVLKTMGLCVSFAHAFSMGAIYSSLQTGPGLIGLPWYESQFDTTADGEIICDFKKLAGGHELSVDELEVDANGNPVWVWVSNSWSDTWGIKGRGKFSIPNLTKLMANQGDYTSPVAVVVAPTPTPGPSPTPPAPPAPVPTALPFIGASAAVTAHITSAAGRAKETVSAYQQAHWAKYFSVD